MRASAASPSRGCGARRRPRRASAKASAEASGSGRALAPASESGGCRRRGIGWICADEGLDGAGGGRAEERGEEDLEGLAPAGVEADLRGRGLVDLSSVLRA